MTGNHKIFGLTGQSGAGKTTVARLFARLGVQVVDCDSVARQTARDHSPCVAEIGRRFPQLVTEGRLDRAKTAAMIFADNQAKDEYQQIIFPYLTYLLLRIIAEAKPGTAVMLDAPTLYESGMDRICGSVIAVTAAEDKMLERIILRDSITEEQAKARLFSQQRDEFFIRQCDYHILNDGDMAALERRVDEVAQAAGIGRFHGGWHNQQV
jgi:dephospho-CoA kinase